VEGHIQDTVPSGERPESLLVCLCFDWSQLTILDFEPLSEKSLPPEPEAGQLAGYDEYLRRELPRAFRSTLEAVVNDQCQPVEENLRRCLIDIIRECQDRVFSQYRATLTSAPIPSSLDNK